MDLTSTFSTKDKFTSAGDYIRLRNTKTYILQKYNQYFDGLDRITKKEKLTQLCHIVGYADVTKFSTHMGELNSLLRQIPKKYFDAISIDYKVLDFVVELDIEEYRNALNTTYLFENFVVRMMPAVYCSARLPEKMYEFEAIKYVTAYSKKRNHRCCLNVADLKSIYVDPDGSSNCSYYSPILTKTKNLIIFSAGNSGNGVTKIG